VIGTCEVLSLNIFKSSRWAQLFILTCLLFHVVLANADENSFGYRIFVMQKKLALKGSVLAQYKLGTLYEFGISVEPNTDEAIIWYKKASEKGNKAASNRLIYLDIKQNGYTQTTQSEWLKKIIDEARIGNVHSLIILGQLYHQGIAVNKDLEKAHFMLQKASSEGHTEVDLEIEEINRKLSQTNETKIVKEVSAPVKQKPVVSKIPKEPIKKKIKLKKTVAKKPVKKTGTKESKESKRKRYEEVMRKQREEQLILDKQQQWSEAE